MIGQIAITLKIKEMDEFDIVLKTMYAPRTIKRIETALPVSQLAIKKDNCIAVTIDNIQVPAEYQKRQFKKGEIAFDISSNNLYIYFNDCTEEKKFNLVGNITSPVDIFSEIDTSKHVELLLKE